jgi:hypothetical protein
MKNNYTLFLLLFIVLRPVFLSAQVNIAPLAVANASTCNTGACTTLNDLNYGTCGTQSMWITTPTAGSFISFTWPTAQTFDRITIHHAEAANRSLTGAQLQLWDGSSFVTFHTFTGLTQQCINTIIFPIPVTTTIFRMFELQTAGPLGQLSNANFREIEIFNSTPPPPPVTVPPIASFAYNDADTIWLNNPRTIVNTSNGADRNYWDILGYNSNSKQGPFLSVTANRQCKSTEGINDCFIDTLTQNLNFK